MKKILIMAIITIILTGCGPSPARQGQGKDSSQPSKLDQQEFTFKKNQECLEFKNEIEKKLNGKKSPFGETSLEQIFYSPKVNSCLYIEYGDQGRYWNRRLLDIRNDGPSSNPLEACLTVENYNDCNEFDKKLEEYKIFE